MLSECPIPAPLSVSDPDTLRIAEGARALLAAIIGQAVHDLRYVQGHYRATAYRFLFDRPSCFERWCGELGLCADQIRARLARELMTGPPDRKDRRRFP